jgi:hypothetical protein
MDHRFFLLIGSLLAACAKTSASPQPVAPARSVPATEQTVVAEVDPTIDGQSIYLVNNSSVTVVVTSIRLTECVNIGSPCTLIPLKIRVMPGSRTRVFTVRPSDPERTYSYRYAWTWSEVGQ